MAHLFDDDGNILGTAPAEPGTGEGATIGDVGRAGAESALSVPAEAASSGQYIAEQADMPKTANILRAFSDLFHGGSESLEAGITPGGKRARDASLAPTEGGASYGETPFSTVFMKTAGMAAPLAVMTLFPETLIGEAVAGGSLQAGQVIDDVIAKTNKLDDKQLAAASPVFKSYVDSGMDPDKARAQLHADQISGRDIAIAGLTGAITMGAPARVLKAGSAAGKTMVKSAITGAGEAGAGTAVSAAEADVQSQKAELAAKKKFDPADIDWHRTMETGLSSLVEGGALGAGGGALHGKRGGKEPAVDTSTTTAEAPPTAPETPAEPLAPSTEGGTQAELPLTGPGRGEAPAPPPTDTTAPPGNAPVQGDLFAPTGVSGHGGAIDTSIFAPKPPKKGEVQTVDANAPDAGQAAALGASGVGPKGPSGHEPTVDEAAAAKIKELKKPPAEAVPTTEAPKAPPAKADGAPDETVTASQPPKGQGTGAAAPPPGATSTADTTKTKKPKGVGPKGKKAIETAAPTAPDAAQTEALKPPGEVPPPPEAPTEAAEAPPPPEAPTPAQPAPPEPTPAQPAAGGPPAVNQQAALADLLRQHEAAQANPTVPPVRADATPPAGAPSVRAPDAAAPSAARPEAAAADLPSPDAQEVSAQAPTPPAPTPGTEVATRPTGTAVAEPRVLEGGSAAPAYDAALVAKNKAIADASDINEARGAKGKTYAENMSEPVSKAEHMAAVREANKAAKTDPKGAHPLYKAIAMEAEKGRQMGRGQSPEKTEQANRVRSLIQQLRVAKDAGEIKPEIAKGGKPQDTTVSPAKREALTKRSAQIVERSKERQATTLKAETDAEARAAAVKAAMTDVKPMSAELREKLETRATDKSSTRTEREKARKAIAEDDLKHAQLAAAEEAARMKPDESPSWEKESAIEAQKARTQMEAEQAQRRAETKVADEETKIIRPAAAKEVVTGKSAFAGLRPKVEGVVSLAKKNFERKYPEAQAILDKLPGVGPKGAEGVAKAKARGGKEEPWINKAHVSLDKLRELRDDTNQTREMRQAARDQLKERLGKVAAIEEKASDKLKADEKAQFEKDQATAARARVTPEVKAERAAHPEKDPTKTPEEKRKSLEEIFKEGGHLGKAHELDEKPNGDRLRNYVAAAGDDIRELRTRLASLTSRELGEIIKTTNRHGEHAEVLSEAKKEAEIRRQDIEKQIKAEVDRGRAESEKRADDWAERQKHNIQTLGDKDLESLIKTGETYGASPEEISAAREEQAQRQMDRDNPTERGSVTMNGQKVRFSKLETTNVGDALKSSEVENHGLLPTGNVALAVSKRVEKLASSVKVHTISAADMQKLVAAHPRLRQGFQAGGFYMPHEDMIVIREGLPSGQREATIFHEAIHAATSREIFANPELKAQVREIMNEARSKAFSGMHNQYGFTDEHEFIAEAFANKQFREWLASKKMSLELKEKLKLPEWRKATGFKGQLTTLWDMVKGVFGRAISGDRGPVSMETASYLEGALASFDRLSTEQAKWTVRDEHTPTAAEMRPAEGVTRPVREALASSVEPEKEAPRFARITDNLKGVAEHLSTATMGSKARQLGHYLMTNDQFRQAKEYLFGAKDESNPMRRLTDAVEKAGVKANEYRKAGDALAARVFALSRSKPEAAAEFARLAEEATMHNVHLDRANDHLSKDGLNDAQAKAVLPKLQADFDKMTGSAPETKQLWGDLVDYFKDVHEKTASQLIDNHLQDVDTSKAAPGLKQRILDGKMTDADKKLMSPGAADALDTAREVQRIQGAYFPLMRRGDFGVRGEMKVDAGGGQKVAPNVIQFKNASDAEARRQAKAYAEKSPLKVLKVKEVWVDGNNPSDITHASDPNAEKAFRVEVQHEHLSFHDNEHDANQMHAALKADPRVASVKDVMLRENHPNMDFEMSSAQVRTIMKSIDQNKSMTEHQKAAAKAAWTDVSHRMMAGNRVEARRLPRRNVAGASRDMVRNIDDYSSSSSAYRAKLEHAREIGDSLEAMHKWADDRQYDGHTLQRNEATREMTDRVYGSLNDMNKSSNPMMQALTTVSYFKAMVSPAHLMLHSTHPWMISAPYMAAEHGVKAFGALSQAYKDIGGVGAVTEGVKSFGRSAKSLGTAAPKNWLDHFEASFKGKDRADIVKMWRALAETGHIHPEAGMEVHRMDTAHGNIMAGMKRIDSAFRELTSTTEALNRFAESTAAYRLARSKGLDHDAAVRYTKDTLANTQGLYSRTNAAPMFRGYMRPFLQFKQFPQMMYHLLARPLYQAFKGETPEIRRQAMKQFAGVVATHALMAGAVGLPLEPIRAVAMLGNALGVPGTDWQGMEDTATKALAQRFGPEAANAVMHGVSGAIGLDTHHRLGQGTLWLGTDPRSNSESDLKSWMFDMAFGALGGTAYDVGIKGPKEIMSGDTMKGLETMSPFKGVTDLLKAGAEFATGKKTARGNQLATPLSIPETIAQAVGFTPQRIANSNAATAAVKRSQVETGRSKAALTQSYLEGKSLGMSDIIKWNAANPSNQISYSGLMKAKREGALPQALGQKVNKGNRALIDATSRAYNLGGVQ